VKTGITHTCRMLAVSVLYSPKESPGRCRNTWKVCSIIHSGGPGRHVKKEDGMRKGVIVWGAMAVFLTAGAAWAADTNTLTVSASVTGTCKFASATSTLSFGNLDPAAGGDVNATPANVGFWCTKGVSTDLISANDGLNYSGTKRQMAGPGGDLIPYTMTLTPDGAANGGPSTPRNLQITGTVLGTDYTGKSAGSYSDTVLVSINP
jgi:spore coat protein U-like protein